MAKSKDEQRREDTDLATVWPDPPVETIGGQVKRIRGADYLRELSGCRSSWSSCRNGSSHEGLKVVVALRGARRRRQGRRDQAHHRSR